jgi:hypothetical protein
MSKSEKFSLIKAVAEALAIAEELGFTLMESALLLGYRDSVGDNPVYLRQELTLRGKGEDVATRCEWVFEIQLQLKRLFGEKTTAMVRWLNVRHETYAQESAKSLMISGDLSKLRQVVDMLANIPTQPD